MKMNFKKFLSAFLVASMLVTSVFSNVGTSVYAQNDEKTEEVRTTEKKDKEFLTESKTENDKLVSNLLKDEKEEDKKEESNKEVDGIQPGTDAKPKVESTGKVEKDETSNGEIGELEKVESNLEEIDRDSISVDLTNNSLKNDSLDTIDEDELVRVIIVVDGNSILDDDINAKVNFFNKIKMSLIEMKQNSVISKIENKVLDGEQLDVHYQYSWLLNGIAAEVPFGLIDDIEKINGVSDVVLQPKYELDTKEESDPNTVADGVMIGRDDVWASGYTGVGMKIAIIDTGLDDDHQNFQAMDESKITEDSLTVEDIEAVLGELNASNVFEMIRGESLTAADLYQSNKVAFAFNYVDVQTRVDHSDGAGDHGTHVAGIAAANDLGNGEAVGTAPDAQLFVMKVFGENGGAYTEDYMAAIEDAILLGADVINLSLGSPAGFTTDGEYIDGVFAKVADTGTVLTISAGNSTTSGLGNLWGTESSLAGNPDNGVVGSPGTYPNVTTVASVENVKIMSYFFEVANKKLGYIEGINASNELFTTLAGQELEFVYVGNFGQTAEDFAAAGDLTGKIALVQRGISSFVSKCELAAQAGAVGVLVYNNTSGTINMDLTGCTATIPCASITKMAGEFMVAALEEGNNTLVFSDTQTSIDNEDAYKMSDFSSWGPTSDLTIGPDITGPGGNIYSTLDNGTYGLMSGTSMSSPNVAGLMALVMEYVKETYPTMSASEMRVFVNALLMSTATPLEYSEGLHYSPRQQGSGLANAYNAINTLVYLSVDGTNEPEAELGDDPEKTGKYEFTFNVNNFGSTDAYYDLSTFVQTEEVWDYYGYKFMGENPIVLSANTNETSDALELNLDYNEDGNIDVRDARYLYDNVLANTVDLNQAFRYDLNQDEVVDTKDVQLYLDMLVDKDVDLAYDQDDEVLKVSANDVVSVTVTVEVTDEGKAYMDENFENGIYVEGFTLLNALSADTVDLSLPYLAFYGDWTQAPILDNGYYYSDESMAEAYHWYNVIFTQYAYDDFAWYPGLNPYVDEEFILEYSSLSPNGDGYADYITDTYVSMFRNAAQLSFTYKDADGKVYFEEIIDHVAKSYYSTGNGICLPYVYTWYSYPYELIDENGEYLENNTKLEYIVHATLDYDKHESNNLSDTWTTPITIDLEDPQIVSYEFYVDEESGRQFLDLVLSDNVATAAVNFLSKNGTIIRGQEAVDHEAEANGTAIRYEVTGYGDQFLVILGDYAFNERAYLFETEDNDPILDKDLLYGYRVADDTQYDYGDMIYGWLSIDKETAEFEQLDSEWYMDYALIAAEYVGGYIIAVDANLDLLYIKPGYWDERTKIATLGFSVRDLAFDPTTNLIYGYATEDAQDNYLNQLFSIDPLTAEVTFIGESMGTVIAMTCDDAGNLYGLNNSGELVKIDKVNGGWVQVEGEDGWQVDDVVLNTREVTGQYPYYAQSMTYDSEENAIYWTAFFYSWYAGSVGQLYKIDLDTKEITLIDTVAGNAEVVGLLMLDDRGFTIPQDEEIVGIEIDQDPAAVLVDGQHDLDVILDPWYGNLETIEWESLTPEIVSVDSEGVVTGLAVGEATIQVTVNGTLVDTSTVKVLNPDETVEGFVLFGNNELMNQWVEFKGDELPNYEVETEMDFLGFYAGEYVDGTIYAYASNGAFYKIDEATKEATQITLPNNKQMMVDMAYDYSTGMMYGILQDMTYGSIALVTIDTNTGNYTLEAEVYDAYDNPPCAITISPEGTIYLLTYTGYLHTYDKETQQLTSLGYVGVAATQMIQTMVYDYNSENPGIYWAYCGSAQEMMYIDIESVTALSLGTIDYGCQMTSMYIIPDEVPTLDEVAVESVTMLEDTVKVLEGGHALINVEVLPYNATDRDVVWVVEDETIAEIKDGLVYGLEKGTTKATGTLAGNTVEVNIEVLEATGEIHGYILLDYSTYSADFWGSFYDNDLSSGGEALTGNTTYELYAGEYYDGKIYGYGVNLETYESAFITLDATTYELESMVYGEYPDALDMAFDYSQGVMYLIAGARNVSAYNSLYAVDITTGTTYLVADLEDEFRTLACTTDGQLYGISTYGTLYQIDKNTGELTYVGDTGKGAGQYQSMFYDHDTGNMYWNQVNVDWWSGTSEMSLFIVDPTDASLLELGTIGLAGCQVSAMHTIPEKELVTSTPEITGVLLNKTNAVVALNDTVQLSAKAMPVSVKLTDVEFTYESSDPTIATVDETGLVTGLQPGSVTITVTAENGVSATCTVKVIGTEEKLQIFTATGVEVSPIVDPTTIDSTTAYPVEGMNLDKVTYYNGYYYSVDKDGNLWKLETDLSAAEQITTTPLTETLDNFYADYYTPGMVWDIFTNTYTDEVYMLASMYEETDWGWAYEYIYLYLLDVETGEASVITYIDSSYIYSPRKAEWISENELVVYDGMTDYVYKLTLEASMWGGINASYNQLVWAQGIMAVDDELNLGMTHAEELGMIYLSVVDPYYNNGNIALYALDYNAKTIKKVSDAAYSTDMIDIVYLP